MPVDRLPTPPRRRRARQPPSRPSPHLHSSTGEFLVTIDAVTSPLESDAALLHEGLRPSSGLRYSGTTGPTRIRRHTPRLAPAMPVRQAATEAAYRIRDWKRYNDALVNRGSLTLRVDQATFQASK
jgi:hypothetical protein